MADLNAENIGAGCRKIETMKRLLVACPCLAAAPAQAQPALDAATRQRVIAELEKGGS